MTVSPSNDRPVHRRASAVLRQQRSMHVQRAALRQVEPRGIQHMPVVEREHEIRPRPPPLRQPLDRVGILGHDDLDAVPFGELFDAREPATLARVVRVRKNQRHANLLIEELAQAAHTHLAVGKYHCTRHSMSSSTASTTYRGRSRTCV